MKFQSESDVMRAPTGQMINKTFKLERIISASRSQSKAITVSHHIVQSEIDTNFLSLKRTLRNNTVTAPHYCTLAERRDD